MTYNIEWENNLLSTNDCKQLFVFVGKEDDINYKEVTCKLQHQSLDNIKDAYIPKGCIEPRQIY